MGFAIPARCAGKIYPGTTIAGVNVGGMNAVRAEDLLRTRFAGWEQHAIRLVHGDTARTVRLADLGYSIDYAASVNRALGTGRQSGFADRYVSWFAPRAVANPIVLNANPETLDELLAEMAAEIDTSPVDASLTISDTGDPVIHDEKPGLLLDRQQAGADIAAAVLTTRLTTVELPTITILPEVSAADLEARKATIAAMIDQPVTIASGEHHWFVDGSRLASALVLPDAASEALPTIDPERLTTFLQPVADALAVDPQDAIVGWNDGLYVIREGKDGQQVDLPALARMVADAASSDTRQVEVPLIAVQPQVHGGNLDSLGITTLLGSGSSSFAGSDTARAENLRTGAMWVDQTLIPPGGVFSFNQTLGPISLDRGYVEGKIISGDWYTSDIGGGVCQVSTTVFRAALFAGLEFLEWHPHSFRLGFYELEGWPPGMDAAIYVPNSADEGELDLVFANRTDDWMLLQLDIRGERLTAAIYGPDTGNRIDIGDPQVGDPIAPPAPLERQDTELEPGERQLVQSEKPGYEVTVRRVVSNGETIVLDNTFYSYYAPQGEIWKVGTTTV